MKKDYFRGPGVLKSQHSLHSLDQKIHLYELRLNGWFINIARALRIDPSQSSGGPGADPVSLMIAMSLFEPHGIYLQGTSTPLNRYGEPESEKNFVFGFSDFLSRKHPEWPNSKGEEMATMIYKQVRCGLFHAGTAKKGVWYDRGPDEEHPTPSISVKYYNSKLVKITFNVPAFIMEVDDYFKQYVSNLYDHKHPRRKLFAEGRKIIKKSLDRTW